MLLKTSVLAIVMAALSCVVAYGQGTVFVETFHSAALDENRNVRIYLPEGYDQNPERVFPIVYFLHGANGNASDPNYSFVFTVLDDLIGQQVIQPVVVAMPDGSAPPFAGSMWADSDLYGDFDTYVVDDVSDHMELNYRVRDDRAGRAITGYSMGGMGCMSIAFLNVDEYCAVASNAGALQFEGIPTAFAPNVRLENGGAPPFDYDPISGTFTYLLFTAAGGYSPNLLNPPYLVDFPLDDQGDVIPEVVARWLEHDPATLAADIVPGSIGIYFNCGSRDELFFFPLNEAFAAILTDLGHPFTYEVDNGFHFSAERVERVRSAFMFLDGYLQDPLSVEDGGQSVPAPGAVSLRCAPNPFNPATTVTFHLERQQWATLTIHDPAGKLIRELFAGVAPAGRNDVVWRGTTDAGVAVPSGTYIASVTTDERVTAAKIQLVR